MNEKLFKILGHALNDMNQSLRRLQERIILVEQFGVTAVYNPDLYAAGDDEKNKFMTKDLVKDHRELLELAKELQNFVTQARDAQFNAGLDDLINQFKKTL